MSQESAQLIRGLRKSLRESADPLKAPAMQAYMKSAMPYLGVQTPHLRKAVKVVFAAHPLSSFEAWRDAVLDLWRGARHREERYAAMELAAWPLYREYRTLDALPLYEEMIVSGAWWDFVDSIAAGALGELLERYPAAMARVLREWAVSENLWKRRSAILSQLSFRRNTDLRLLYACIRPSFGASEFFLRKAIGWALRQYARTDPDEVRRFVRRHDMQLSALSKREALRHIGP